MVNLYIRGLQTVFLLSSRSEAEKSLIHLIVRGGLLVDRWKPFVVEVLAFSAMLPAVR